MRKSKIIYTIVLIVTLIFCTMGVCEATGIGISDMSGYRPDISGTANGIISGILKVLRIAGACVLVVSIALIGFSMMLGSASEKAVAKEKFIGIIIAAVLLIAGSTIAEIIMSAANSI